MPYLTKEVRTKLDEAIDSLIEQFQEDGVSIPGGINYAICRMADGVVAATGESYSIYNTLLGSLECAKQEIYRRMIAPYEDFKCQQNGEVFDRTKNPPDPKQATLELKGVTSEQAKGIRQGLEDKKP